MRYKWLWALFLIFGIMAIGMVFNPSYQKSLEARFYYTMGDYQKAYRFAKEAFDIDRYNRMASTVMTQSQTALKFVRYNTDAKRYTKQIKQMVEDGNLSRENRAKIRMISKVMIDSYNNIAPTVVTDKALIDESKKYYEGFKNLHDEMASH